MAVNALPYLGLVLLSGQRQESLALFLGMLVLAMFAVEKIDVGEIDYMAAPRHSRGFDNVAPDDNDIHIPEPHAW